MAQIEIYEQYTDEIKSNIDILNYIIIWSNIIKSNRDKNFFVNRENPKKYLKKYDEEIALLNVITESKKPLERLEALLEKYPKINKIIPILLAVSEDKVELQLDDEEFNTKIYKFENSKESIEFIKVTGLENFIESFSSIRDYIFWIKVWMDTNWRKNRSWEFNERKVKEILLNKIEDKEIKIHSQKQFNQILPNDKIQMLPQWYWRKKCDFILEYNNQFINIEVNHFWWWWSKQEILDAYRTRKNDLAKAWIWFVRNTDGSWWHKVEKESSKLNQAIQEMDFITNIKMLKNTNLLNWIINFYFKN